MLNATILIVDDESDNLQILSDYLLQTDAAYRILQAKNGAIALKILEKENVDLVITDWNMPIMDGMDLLKNIKSNERTTTIPVIMQTAETEDAKLEWAFREGAMDYIKKPISRMELKARIRSALSLSFANKELKSTYEVVLEQKIKIEDSSRKMTDSIRYAKRIQQAILPLIENIEEYLKEFFIIYKPLDIISGDFYYFEAVENHIILATIDCTGHGVPGALMSMLGKEILNKIIIDKKIFEPDKILLELDKGIKSALQQDETDNQDGMDISILVIDTVQHKASYSGAKNPIIFITNGELKEIKGSPFGIGGDYENSNKHFESEVFDIVSPTMFYLFSDGFQDQFGGTRNKKFMISKMRELFKEIHEKPVTEQKNILVETIENWIMEGNESQTDDIMLWGFRI